MTREASELETIADWAEWLPTAEIEDAQVADTGVDAAQETADMTLADGEPLDTLEELTGEGSPGILFGRYRLDEVWSQTPRGLIYLATDRVREHSVMLEIFSARMNERSIGGRFAMIDQVRHANIARIYDYGVSPEGEPYLATERPEGRSLDTVIVEDGPLPFDRIIELGIGIALALREAHLNGVVHGALTASSVTVRGSDGSVCLRELGLASIFDPRATAGSVARALELARHGAPEQAQNPGADARSDMYALGVILFHMITGSPPFDGASAVEIANWHVSAPVPLVSVTGYGRACPQLLEAAVRRCLSKVPADRFASMDQLIVELNSVREQFFAATPVPQLIPRAPSLPPFPAMSTIVAGLDLPPAVEDPPAYSVRAELVRPISEVAPAPLAPPVSIAPITRVPAVVSVEPKRGRTRMFAGFALAGIVAVAAIGSFALQGEAPATAREQVGLEVPARAIAEVMPEPKREVAPPVEEVEVARADVAPAPADEVARAELVPVVEDSTPKARRAPRKKAAASVEVAAAIEPAPVPAVAEPQPAPAVVEEPAPRPAEAAARTEPAPPASSPNASREAAAAPVVAEDRATPPAAPPSPPAPKPAAATKAKTVDLSRARFHGEDSSRYALMQGKCTKCHDLGVILESLRAGKTALTQKPFDAEGMKAQVVRCMRLQHSNIDKDDAREIMLVLKSARNVVISEHGR